MKLQKHDLLHGLALTQIVKYRSFKALNRGSKKFGHYRVNDDRDVFIKYRTNSRAMTAWIFPFLRHELTALRKSRQSGRHVFLCLVCVAIEDAEEQLEIDGTVCVLNVKEIGALIDLDSQSRQWIRVEVPSGGSCHVSASGGRTLEYTVRHSDFPKKIFKRQRP